MKRAALFLLVLGLLLIPPATVSANTTWTLGDLQNGHWSELFGPGGEGSAGGALYAAADDDSQWVLSALQSGAAVFNSTVYDQDNHPVYNEYTSNYSSVLTLMDASLFGSDPIDITLATATNISRHYVNGNLGFDFTATGTGSDGYVYTLAASWFGTRPWYDPGMGHASFVYADSNGNPIEGYYDNIGFTSLSLTRDVAAVPVPATVLLLGPGLLGLVGIRRKIGKG